MNNLNFIAATNAIADPVGQVICRLKELGHDREAINAILAAMRPILSHAMVLEARIDRAGREGRTQAQLAEGTGP